MPRFKAINIEQLDPGSVIEIEGRRYMRMLDHPGRHMEGWVVDLGNGWSGHWSLLVLGEEMVAVEADAPAPAATYQGHHPDGSSVQRHSAGIFYPYVLVLRDSKDPSRRYDWGLMGPDVDGTIWMRSSEAWERLAIEERAMAASKRGDRWSTVESIKVHEQNAADYEATARGLRAAGT